MTADSSIAWGGPSVALSIWLTSATDARWSSVDRGRKSRTAPFAPKMRISRGPRSGKRSVAAAGTAVSPATPIAMTATQPHRRHARRTPPRLWALVRVVGLRRGRRGCRLGSRRRYRRCGPRGEGAGHAVDERVGVSQLIRVVAPETARRPAKQGRPHVLGSREEVVVADLVHAGGLRVPLVGGRRQRLLHELVPDRGGAHDPGRVEARGGVIRVADPDRRRQRRREADRLVVAEGLGGTGFGGDVPAWQCQVTVAAERHAAVAVVRHDGGNDVGHVLANGAVLVLGGVVGEDVFASRVLDGEN